MVCKLLRPFVVSKCDKTKTHPKTYPSCYTLSTRAKVGTQMVGPEDTKWSLTDSTPQADEGVLQKHILPRVLLGIKCWLPQGAYCRIYWMELLLDSEGRMAPRYEAKTANLKRNLSVSMFFLPGKGKSIQIPCPRKCRWVVKKKLCFTSPSSREEQVNSFQ